MLAQKRIKITQVAKDTGLSRTTLTTLSQNKSKRIDNETLNSLCNYLRITPNTFFEYTPLDFEIESSIDNITSKIDPVDGIEEKNGIVHLDLLIKSFGKKVDILHYKGDITFYIEKKEVLSGKVLFENETTIQNNKNRYLQDLNEIMKDSFLVPEIKEKIDYVVLQAISEAKTSEYSLINEGEIDFSFNL
ncbi:helix-turn-helix domain-containing protein [Lactococcus formosensis subsp. bovis]|uniref:helix-turn-helix domain-containing protein n=1 Tax=Lactococcus formosensis TaxID=1281486 RepID=UPI0024BE4AFF